MTNTSWGRGEHTRFGWAILQIFRICNHIVVFLIPIAMQFTSGNHIVWSLYIHNKQTKWKKNASSLLMLELLLSEISTEYMKRSILCMYEAMDIEYALEQTPSNDTILKWKEREEGLPRKGGRRELLVGRKIDDIYDFCRFFFCVARNFSIE